VSTLDRRERVRQLAVQAEIEEALLHIPRDERRKTVDLLTPRIVELLQEQWDAAAEHFAELMAKSAGGLE